MSIRAKMMLAAAGAFLGLMFATVSTYDFVRRLDRQVHSVHCSFIPGMGADISGGSDCEVTMMSPYSSIWRDTIWGGIPISLLAMAVFVFVLFFAADILLTKRESHPRMTGMFVLATAVPVAASLVMGVIALVELGAACKLCIGIYAASALCFFPAFIVWRHNTNAAKFSESNEDAEDSDEDDGVFESTAIRKYRNAMVFAAVLFVGFPTAAYVAAAPEHDDYITSCGTLDYPKDRYNVMLPVPNAVGADVPVVEVLDPLCPACRAFEHRLEQTDAAKALDRKLLLFPLDNACNWMVDSPIHPGACTISEAMLCANEGAPEVLAWAFENQESLLAASKDNPRAAKDRVLEKFPNLRGCVGSGRVRARLNRSLRWAVSNRIKLLTPQLYVAGVKLCDEDVDLGLSYALRNLVSSHRAGTLPTVVDRAPPPTLAERAAARNEGKEDPDGTVQGPLDDVAGAENAPQPTTGEDSPADSVAPGLDGSEEAKQALEDPPTEPTPIEDAPIPDMAPGQEVQP